MMLRRRAVLSLSLAFLMLLTTNVQSPSQSRAASPGIAIALGDSIAAGIGSSLPRSRGYAAIVAGWLARLTGEPVPSENLAVPGETATTFTDGGQLQRFRDTVANARAASVPIALVTVSLGGNELLGLGAQGLSDRQAGLDEFRARYDEALGAIRDEIGPDTPLAVLTLYDPTEGDALVQYTDAWWIGQFNAVIRNAATEHLAAVAEVGARFAGKTADYTRYPSDVHPTNAGHLVIAQSIWSTLAFDAEPPSIVATPNLVATRLTPTIQFSVDDNLGVSSVSVRSDDVMLRGPFETATNRYVVLVDLGTTDREEVALTIEISDDGGNVTRREITVQPPATSRSESQ